MREALTALRREMKKQGISFWISPCQDAHGSEYISAHDECVRFLSGFTGDSCTLLVSAAGAWLWTDGRYFVQAEQELKGSGVKLMKMGEPEVPTLEAFLRNMLKEGEVLGFCAELISAKQGRRYLQIAEERGATLRTDRDLPGRVWKERPARSKEPIWVHAERYAGESAAEKLKLVREEMREQGATVFITSALGESAWLTNLRGSDIACNPMFLSYLVVKPHSAAIYLQKEALTPEAEAYLHSQKITVKRYDRFLKSISLLKNERLLMDSAVASYAMLEALDQSNELLDGLSPIYVLKSVKNSTEIEGMKACHIRDGVYLTRFLYWVKKHIREAGESCWTETELSDRLDALRAEDPDYVSLSFPTISAYGANAAMCHYSATPESAAAVEPRGLYLVDSGAQYLDGTTDVTRTVAVGETTEEERQDYTLAVIGMLNLMGAVFPYGTRGMNLDTYARQAMWARGRDFNHGTGHGVGHLNNVHEMPVSVRFRPHPDPRRDIPFVPGMVTSDEPGIYIEGSHGVRSENLILCVPHPDYEGFYTFEALTMAPLDPEPLELSLMKKADIRRFNRYQQLVYETLAPLLGEEERAWLAQLTAKIKKDKKDKHKKHEKNGKI